MVIAAPGDSGIRSAVVVTGERPGHPGRVEVVA